MSSPRLNPLTVAFVALAVIGLAVAGAVAWIGTRDTEVVVGEPGGQVAVEGQPTAVALPPTPVTEPTGEQPQATPVPAEQPVPTAEPAQVSTASADISDEMIEAALAQAASSPLVGLPSRDEIATVRLIDQLQRAGHDLTGMEFSIYPASSADSFVLLETSDSTALLASDAGETFVTDLLDSPIIAEYEVERLVLRHNTTDEVGPLLVTMMIPVREFQEAVASGADVFTLFAVQTERP